MTALMGITPGLSRMKTDRPASSRNWQFTSKENDTSPRFPDVLCRIRMISQCVFPTGEGQSFTANLQAFHVMVVRVVDPG